MANWSLYKASPEASTSSLVGYSVLDAVGVPLGTVSGWAYDASGRLAGLRMGVRGFLKQRRHYLLPLGYVTQIDPRHRFVHLREVTRRTLTDHAAPADDALPPPEVVVAIVRRAPNPRPEIRTILEDPHSGPVFLQPGRLTVAQDQGDGAGRTAPLDVQVPEPTSLAQASEPSASQAPGASLPAADPPPTLPPWSPLASFRPDEGAA